MSALDNTPVNKNFLSPINFNFSIQRAPHLNFFVQSVNIPGISLLPPAAGTPFSNIPVPGDRLHYQELIVQFKVDEDLQDYLELHNWIRSLGFPEDFTEYAQIAHVAPGSAKGTSSDITLLVSNQIRIPKWQITFRNAFPVSISSLNFSTTDSDVQYITASANFRYIFYDIAQV